MTANRPERLVLVLGTGTEVGKTWVACRLARSLRQRGLIVAARKLAQSYEAGDDLSGTDAALLAHATGDHPAAVCPQHRWYPWAMAPPMAAEALGRPPFTVADLLGELSWPPGVGVGLLEAAGGVRSPLAADGEARDLVHALRPDRIVLVAEAGLGTINAVRLSLDALAGPGGHHPPTTVVLNRFDAGDDLHVRNHEWLTGVDGTDVVTGAEDLVARVVGWPG
ncbi:MAG TPA: dethiobiotin synthase [Acidimicrobiales bacterium]|nr:dethiobiotin synthase [Acidimicrobiales bacterium]